MKLNGLLPMCLFFLGCSTQVELNDKPAGQSSNAVTQQAQGDGDQSGPEIEEGEEEVDAEIPVVVTGAPLTCQPLLNDETALSCKFSMEDRNVFESLEPEEILEIMDDEIGPINFRIRKISHEQGVIILASTKSDIDLLKKRSREENLVFEAIRKVTATTEPTATEPTAAQSPATVPPDSEDPLSPSSVLSDLNLIVNGSFEDDVIADGAIQKVGFENGLNNWMRTLGVTSEIQRGVSGWLAQEGSQWTELCSTGDSGIVQAIPTIQGQSYQLQFYFSPQPLVAQEFNHLHVKIAGQELFHESADGTALTQTNWTFFTVDFTAESSSTEIEFFSSGCTDANGVPVSNMGTFLDDVKVFEYIPSVRPL